MSVPRGLGAGRREHLQRDSAICCGIRRVRGLSGMPEVHLGTSP